MNSLFKKALAVIVVMCFSCAGSPESSGDTGVDRSGGSTPQWVTDVKKVYPENAWIAAVESGQTKQLAQSFAASSLARTFKVDVKSVTNAMQGFTETTQNGRSNLSQSNALQQQVDTTTDVAGLMGVIVDSWTAKDGTVFVCARMNKKEGSTLYSSIINENDKNIKTLMDQAVAEAKTFKAYQALNFAYNIATLNDEYMNILSVLDSDARESLKLSYGNATAVRRLAMNAANDIVVKIVGSVTMSKDIAGSQQLDSARIAKSFQQVFSTRKFKTAFDKGDALYTLTFDVTIDKVELKGNPYQFARYVIKAALTDEWKEEILSFSDNNRSGHTTMSEAVQRAIRDVEKAITEGEFATQFDEYLASLLK